MHFEERLIARWANDHRHHVADCGTVSGGDVNQGRLPFLWPRNINLTIPLPVLSNHKNIRQRIALLRRIVDLGTFPERDVKCGLVTKFDKYFQRSPESLVSGLKIWRGFDIVICRWKESSLQFNPRKPSHDVKISRFSLDDEANLPLTIRPRSVSKESPPHDNVDTPLRRQVTVSN